MSITLDVMRLQREHARPHYLIGNGVYAIEKNEHGLRTMTLKCGVRFPNTRDSIYDRMKMSHPHVNEGDATFAVWSAVHIMADQAGYGTRLIRKGEPIITKVFPWMFADHELQLEAKVVEETKHNSSISGTLYASLKQDGKVKFEKTVPYIGHIKS